MDTPPDQNPSPPAPEPTPVAPTTEALTPGTPTAEEKQWAMFCHLGGLVGHLLVGFGHVVAPLVLWLIKREQMPFVNQEGKEAVNFQISITIYLLIAGLSIYVCIGIVLMPAVIVFDIIVVVMACIDSSNGKGYKYPLCIRFIQ